MADTFNMAYFSYHNKIKQLIKDNHLIGYEFLQSYKNFGQVLMLYFDNHAPMPIREYRFEEYEEILRQFDATLNVSK